MEIREGATPAGNDAEDLSAKTAIEEYRLQKFSQQRFGMALVMGAVASAASAVIWALITVATKYQIGWMAIGVGALVGVTVRFFGKGMEIKFGVVGAIFAILGCLMGNLLATCIFASNELGMGVFEVIGMLDMEAIMAIYKESFSPIDLLFYGFAIYEGFQFSFSKITEEELRQVVAKSRARA